MNKLFPIRKIDEYDLARVSEMQKLFMPHHITPGEWLEKFDDYKDHSFIWEDDRYVVGYIITKLGQSSKLKVKEGYIMSMVVYKQYWGSNGANHMMKHILDHYSRLGINKIVLEVRTNNLRAINFYIKHGFRMYAFKKAYHDNGDDAYIMRNWRPKK